MSHKIYLHYQKIVEKAPVFIDFLIKKSETFSIVTTIKKPYSQQPPSFNYDKQLYPFVKRYISEKGDWLVDFLGRQKHQIMLVCCCCKESRKQLLELPNIFLPIENGLPEDICFYRKGKLWFATISHEKIAFVVDATEEDISFFRDQGTISTH